jgi:UDP-2,3-diacylglucosamine hydrolase
MPKKTFFASDFHLGARGRLPSAEREKQIVRWLDQIRDEAEALYLIGDLFDFWFEYKTVIPKGFLRLQGKLTEWREAGIPVYFFTGNHDMWMFRYFEEELGIPVYREPIIREIGGKVFFIGHGDGLGPGDRGYKFIKRVFANPIAQWAFRWIHPDIGIGIANFWSRSSREANRDAKTFLGPEKEWLVTYSNEQLDTRPADYYIFGHRHLPIDYTLKNGTSRYINLGDWTDFNSFAVYDGTDLQLSFFENPQGRAFPY